MTATDATTAGRRSARPPPTAIRRLGDRHRPRGPRRAGHPHQAVLRSAPTSSAASRTPTSTRVSLGLPGSLPVLNEQAVELAVRVGLALNCKVQRSVFARKNYFYPDMPKDYQISQYDQPINVDGWLELPDGQGRRHRPGPSRGGHGQVDPPRRRRAHPGRLVLPRRLQPGRGPAARDRARARPAFGRRGPGLRRGAALHPRRRRRLRREDGGGLAAGRLPTCRSATGATPLRHPLRDQERQLAAPPRAGPSTTRSPARSSSSRRASGSRQQTRHWDEARGGPARARQGEGRGLPLLPRARPGAGRSRPGVDRTGPGGAAAAACRAPAPAGRGRRGRPASTAVAIAVERGLDDLASPPSRPAPTRPARSPTLEHNLADERRRAGLDPAASPPSSTMEIDGKLTATQAKTVLADLVAAGGDADPAIARRGPGLRGHGRRRARRAWSTGSSPTIPAEWERFVEGDARAAS